MGKDRPVMTLKWSRTHMQGSREASFSLIENKVSKIELYFYILKLLS
jgi:hypothetical protein